MFRTGLLTSTAMTAAALLLSGVPAQAQTDMHVAQRDQNTRFLCTYGQFVVSAFSNNGSGAFVSEWTHVAVPVTGHGQTVRRIKVVEARNAETNFFTIGIYSNTASGYPGKLLVGGNGEITTFGTCGRVTVSIAPTRLKRNTTYWIEETVRNRTSSSSSDFYWYADPDTKRKAYKQHHRKYASSGCSCSGSSTSPWTKQTTGPYLKLR